MKIIECDLAVIGAGPGGYAAAFRAADKGLQTVLIEKYPKLGGVCLNVGCIPSKALLHLAALKEEMEVVKDHGLEYSGVKVNLDKMRSFKDSVINQMTTGLKQLSRARKVTVVQGVAEFMDANNLVVKGETEQRVIFKNVIIATGSKPVIPASMDLKSDLIMDSSDALKIESIPSSLLVIGGGVIGLEMGSVYAGLGSEVTVIEALDKIAGGADPDLTKILQKKLNKSFKSIKLNCMVEKMEVKGKKVSVTYTDKADNDQKTAEEKFDKVLVSVGRKPNHDSLKLNQIGVETDERGFIKVDNQFRTNLAHVFAIGDTIGGAMLAHKAAHEGLTAIEVILGNNTIFDKRGIPSVIYTDPEIAWVGLTESEAKAQNIAYKVGSFPWAASGRAVSMAKKDGLTKILFDPKTERVLGVGIAGANAGELIAEGCLALEMGAVMEDIALTVHAHPTVSETFMEAAENLHGMSVHIYSPPKK